MTTRMLGLLAVSTWFVFAAACSEAPAAAPASDAPHDAGSPDVVEGDGGTSSLEPAALVERLVGKWTVSQGSSTLDCPGTPGPVHDTEDDKGNAFDVRKGSAPNTIVVTQGGNGCEATFEVHDDGRAAAMGEPTCSPKSPTVTCDGTYFDGGLAGGHRHDGGAPQPRFVTKVAGLVLGADGRTIVETFKQELLDWASVCDGPEIVMFDCEVNGLDTLEKQ